MIDLFNKLQYDAWVLGNHEFDWGPEVVLDALTRSAMPVLTANMNLDGRLAGSVEDQEDPLARVVPHLVREVGGFRIGLIGLITPGLPYWLRPELTKGFEVLAPEEILKAGVRFLREEAKVDAVVVCGHMGLRSRDDFANPVRGLLGNDSGIDVFLGGHTHRNHPSQERAGTLYTQADYFGIHCGRVDLVFDRESRALVARRAVTEKMDAEVDLDPLVLEVSAKDLEDARTYMGTQVGTVVGIIAQDQPAPGQPSPLQHLLSSALEHAAQRENLKPDGVFHGTFGTGDLGGGPKTMSDLWEILPYENGILALYLTREELVAVFNESLATGSDRALYGFEVEVAQAGAPGREEHFVRSLRSLRNPGQPAGHRYCVLCNSYEGQSGGQRLMRLRALAENPECKARLLAMTSREALVDFFRSRESIRASALRPGTG